MLDSRLEGFYGIESKEMWSLDKFLDYLEELCELEKIGEFGFCWDLDQVLERMDMKGGWRDGEMGDSR